MRPKRFENSKLCLYKYWGNLQTEKNFSNMYITP